MFFDEIERQERGVVEVRVCLRRQQALADDLDLRADRVDLGVLGRLRDLGEAPAHPQPFDVVDRRRLEMQGPQERDLTAVDVDLRGLQLLPARAVPVLPLEQARHVAAAALGRAEEDLEQRVVAGVREPRVAEIDVALDALRAVEDLERSMTVPGNGSMYRLFSAYASSKYEKQRSGLAIETIASRAVSNVTVCSSVACGVDTCVPRGTRCLVAPSVSWNRTSAFAARGARSLMPSRFRNAT